MGVGFGRRPFKLSTRARAPWHRSQKCVGEQFAVVCFSAFAQDQVGSTPWLIVDRLEPATWEAHYDDIALLNLDKRSALTSRRVFLTSPRTVSSHAGLMRHRRAGLGVLAFEVTRWNSRRGLG